MRTTTRSGADWLMAANLIHVGHAVRRELRHLTRFEDGPYAQDFRGMCAVAAATMVLAMRLIRLHGAFVLGSDGLVEHCWVEWRGFAIDVTHSQFDRGPSVLIAPAGSVGWAFVEEARSSAALRRVSRWGEQSPRANDRTIRRAARAAAGLGHRRQRALGCAEVGS